MLISITLLLLFSLPLIGYFKGLGVHHVFDTNFARSLSLLEAQKEFIERYKRKDSDPKAFPMLASACPGKQNRLECWINFVKFLNVTVMLFWNNLVFPSFFLHLFDVMVFVPKPGWICYAEKTHGSYILPYISSVRSPQQVMGALVKDLWAAKNKISPEKVIYWFIL